MHPANWAFWTWAARTYRDQFVRRRIVEVGSRLVGNRRRERQSLGIDLLRDVVATYVGVDWQPGPNVDMLSVWHEAPLELSSFDTVVSASMLEHDPYHDRSIAKMAEVLVDGGWLFLSWGASRNHPHLRSHDPSGANRHYARPAEQTVRRVRACGLDVGLFIYEKNLEDVTGERVEFVEGMSKGIGEVCLIAVKGKWPYDRRIDEYLRGDRL